MNRRRFLRSTGGAFLALPSLESLAGTPAGKVAAAGMPQKFVVFYSPIGFIRRGFFPGETDAVLPKFQGPKTPDVEGAVFKPGTHELKLTPTLEPLAGLRDRMTLVTGLDRTFQEGTDVHAQCASCFLSSAAPYGVKQSAWPLERTLDHLIGDHIGNDTPFRTLEFSANSHKDNKESIYFDNISWYGTGHLAPSIRDPRKMYQRLFSTQENQRYRDVTDLVLEDARSMHKDLGYSDGQKFAEYFDSIRAIENQMERLEKMRSELSKVQFDEPAEAYLPRGEFIRLMGDLMVVALQTGLTNVTTFMVGPERWDTPYRFEGLFDKPKSHHGMSHNQTKEIDNLLKVDRFHMEQYVYLLEKMEAIEEADGSSLLDNTLFTYGSGLGDGSTHQYNDLPIIVAGSGGGKFKTGRHINMPEGTPLANLWLTQARAMGLRMERFADSTGEIAAVKA